MKSIANAFALVVLCLGLAGCATMRGPVPLGAGDWVLAKWQADAPYFYPGVITERLGDDLSIQYDDGDAGVQPVRNVRRFDWRAGTRLECRWTDGNWYPARIVAMGSTRVDMDILYDDGDRQTTDTSQCRDR